MGRRPQPGDVVNYVTDDDIVPGTVIFVPAWDARVIYVRFIDRLGLHEGPAKFRYANAVGGPKPGTWHWEAR